MSTAHTKVAIIGGDPVIGVALEILLQAAGYHTRFLSEPEADELGGLLADSQLLVVAPTLGAERRRALLSIVSSPATSMKIPVLELLPADAEQRLRGGNVLLWPCSTEELRLAIEAALLAQR
jgi:hypothetical protein